MHLVMEWIRCRTGDVLHHVDHILVEVDVILLVLIGTGLAGHYQFAGGAV